MSTQYYVGSRWFQDSLLRTTGQSAPKPVKTTGRAAVFPLVLILFTFFNLGLWLAIVGPTLPDLHSNSHNQQFSTTLCVVTLNAIASILGLLLGAYLFQLTNVFFIIPLCLLLGGIVTIIIPWVDGANGILVCFFLQGSLMGLIERGALNLYIGFWRRRATILHLFYVSLAVGGFVAPLLATPFVFSRMGGGDFPQTDVNATVAPLNISHRTQRSVNASGSDIPLPLGDGEASSGLLVPGADNETTGSLNMTANISPATSTTVRVKKPSVADGNQLPKIDSTFAERKLAKLGEVKADASLALAAASNSTTSSMTSSPTTTTSTTIPTESTFLPSSIVVPSTTVAATTTTQAPTTVSTTTTVPAQKSTLSSTDLMNVTVPVTSASTTWRDYWRHFLHEVKSNRSQMAYVIISVVPILVVLLMCCAVACRFGADMRNWQTPPPTHGGTEASMELSDQMTSGQQRRTKPQKSRIYATMVATLFFFLLVGMESSVYNLLTYYVAVGKGIAQSTGVELTAVFWVAMAISRLISMFSRSGLSSRVVLTLCHIAMILISSIMFAFTSSQVTGRMISSSPASDASWTLLWFCFAGFGLAIGPILPVTLVWLDERLHPSVAVLALMVGAGHAGRAVVPISTAAGMVSYDPTSLVLCICVGSVLSAILAMVMYKLGRLAGELQVLTDLTKEVRGHNGDVAVYHQTHGYRDGGGAKRVEVKDYPVNDELLFDIGGAEDFEAGDDFVHFDLHKDLERSRRADITQKVSSLADSDGKFSNYFAKM